MDFPQFSLPGLGHVPGLNETLRPVFGVFHANIDILLTQPDYLASVVVVHFNVVANPSSQWTAQQVVEAFPFDTAPRFLLHERDATYGAKFRNRVRSVRIEEVLTAPRSP